MGDLGDKVKDWLLDNLPPSVLAGAGAGAMAYAGIAELGGRMQEHGISLYHQTPLTAIAVAYGFAAFEAVMGLYERIQFRAYFRRFMDKIGGRQALEDIVHAAAPAVLIPIALKSEAIAETIGQGRLDGLPALALNLALPAIPIGIIAHHARQAFLRQKPKRTLELLTGNVEGTFGDPTKALASYEEANRHYPSQFLHFAIAKKHAELGNIEDAMLSVYRGYEAKKDEPLLQSAAARRKFVTSLAHDYRKVMRRLERRPDDLELRLRQMVLHSMADNRQHMLLELERLATEHGEARDDLQLLYAMMLLQEGFPELASQRLGMVMKSLTGKGHGFARIGESANEVLEYRPNKLIRGVIVLKKGGRERLESEARMTSRLEEVLDGHAPYRVPKVLAIIGKGDDRYLVLKRGEGMLLEDVAETGAYLRAADFLAYLHAKVPHGASAKGKRPLALSTKSRLRNPHLQLPAEIAKEVIRNYRPVYDALEGMPQGIHCDAHPRNWMMLDDGDLLKLDNEDKGVVPVGFDVVSMGMGRADMDAIIEAYWEGFSRYRGPDASEKGRFRLGCLNSIVYRAIAFLAAWSSPGMPGMRSRRAWAVRQAMESIDRIRDEHGGYHRQHQAAYGGLQQALKAIVITLGPASRA